uniref:Uncharacterized protein n=1 Tax=Physcomitrium patens TaxID=3218 RepID=A0A7I4CIC6_PHYPA
MTISRASKQIQLRVCNCGITRFASLAEAPASAKRRPTTPAPARLQAAHRLACTTHPLMLNSARYPATSLTCKPANPGTIRKTHTICSASNVNKFWTDCQLVELYMTTMSNQNKTSTLEARREKQKHTPHTERNVHKSCTNDVRNPRRVIHPQYIIHAAIHSYGTPRRRVGNRGREAERGRGQVSVGLRGIAEPAPSPSPQPSLPHERECVNRGQLGSKERRTGRKEGRGRDQRGHATVLHATAGPRGREGERDQRRRSQLESSSSSSSLSFLLSCGTR